MLPAFILPGFNVHNKDWADKCKLNLPGSTVNYWAHWQGGSPSPTWIEDEAQKVISQIGSQKVNLLAKSMGTAIAGQIITLKPDLIDHVCLCGIPLNDLQAGDEKYYLFLHTFPLYKLLIMQNNKDPHGSFTQVQEVFKTINPELQVTQTLRPDHEYPYFSEFIQFFT
jgi:pimeloyl-ACP methyl ester carboxylesterase